MVFLRAVFVRSAYSTICHGSDGELKDHRANNNQPTTVQAINDWICNQSNIVKGNVRGRSELRLHAEYGKKDLTVSNDFYSRLFTYVRIKKHLSMNGFLQRFVQQMVDAGCTVHEAEGRAAKDNPILESQKEKLEMIKDEQTQQVADAKYLTEDDFLKLHRDRSRHQQTSMQ
ncbi:hypothetical protein BGZ54_003958, partial [Gamsiella multidivaricata]